MAEKTLKLSGTPGFREGTVSAHTSRTMMLPELSLVLGKGPAAASDAYATAIVDDNALGKPPLPPKERRGPDSASLRPKRESHKALM